MTIEYDFENDLGKIKVPEGVTLDKDTLEALQESMKESSGCWTRGPLSLCWSFSGESICVSVSVFGVSMGKICLNPARPCARISINLFLVKGYIELCYKDKCLILNGEICKFGNCSRFSNVRVVCF